MKALFFGSIGTVIETSEIQRQSFNKAFKDAGLNWYWNIATYCNLLNNPGKQVKGMDSKSIVDSNPNISLKQKNRDIESNNKSNKVVTFLVLLFLSCIAFAYYYLIII